MKLAYVTVVLVLILCIPATTSAQRPLDRAEALEILQKLTSGSSATWLRAGTIEARHQKYRAPRITDAAEIDQAIQQEVRDYQQRTDRVEQTEEMQQSRLEAVPFNVRYEMANEYTMNSNVVVKYDGSRFLWKIDVTSRSDSVTPEPALAGNQMIERFDVATSGERVFVWDGQQYTIQSIRANHAIVDAANRLPRAVNGPLTAGIIPWGQARLSLQNLRAADIAAVEVVRDRITQIEMTIEQADGLSITCVLDPAKDYVATSYTITDSKSKILSRYYSGYRQVSGNWIPTTILIEQHDLFTDRLLGSDRWDLTVVDGRTPGAEQFAPAYRADTVIEYHSPLSAKTSVYHYSNEADSDQLLAKHLAYTAGKGRQRQNCATAAIKYAAAKLGKSIPDRTLASLVDPEGQTPMQDLKQFAQRQGLHCRAVRADLATLKDLPDCQAILHLPNQNHFVVLDRVDQRDAWIVDLSKSVFYYRKDKDALPLDWSGGVALLLSRQPISGPLAEIDDRALATVSGGDGYTCTVLIQKNYYTTCTTTDYDCWGDFTWYYHRWGCEAAPSGSCPILRLGRYARDECYFDIERGACNNDGTWTIWYMYACD